MISLYRHSPADASDDQILRRRAETYLRQRLDSFPPIEIAVENGTVILQGLVASCSVLWRCRECCRRIAGVMKVVDFLFVVPSHHLFPAQASPSTDREARRNE